MQAVGIGTRVLNFMVDTIFIAIVSILCFNGYNTYVRFYNLEPFNYGWFFFGFTFIYYTLMEFAFGRSLGKFLSYSKVVNAQGKKPGIGAIVLRSATRIILIDAFFIPFLDKTLHDYVSKTHVVEV
jgi:uncharacterized RDD family membrane protein YckC